MSASGRGARSRDDFATVFANCRANRKDFWPKKNVRRHTSRKRLASPALCRVSVVRASPRCHFSARNACERVGRARTPSPPPKTLSSPPADDMARGLSREQSKEKNLKKQAGGNKGNTEGLTPQARAERCGTRFLVSFSRSLTRAHAPRRFAPSERATPSVSRVTRPRVDPVGPDRSNPDDARPFRVQANDRSISRRSLVVAVRIRVPVDRVVRR